VNSPGKFVIGSRGYVRSKDQTDASTGNVSLTLRGQWVVGVKSDDMQRLINGETSVAAEVVAFLEPYEQGPGRDQQISDLAFGISAGNFVQQFTELLDVERARALPSGALTDTGATEDDPLIDDPFAPTSEKRASDSFGTSETIEVKVSNKGLRRKRRERRSQESGRDSEPQQSTTSTEWDPFA